MKLSVLVLMILYSIILIIAPAKAQSIRIMHADTIFAGYNSGETSSVKIINHGTNLIYNHSGKLYEMNALTYKPIREIKLEGNPLVTKFNVDENCKYIIYNSNADSITMVADYNSGKTIKILYGSYYITKDNLFLYIGQSYDGYDILYKFAKLKLNGLLSLDTFKLKVIRYGGFEPKLRRVNTIYNTNTLLVGTGGHLSGQYDVEYDPSWYVLNFEADTKSYINLRVSKHFQKDIYSSMFESKDGTYTAISQSFSINPDTKENQFLIYDSNYNYLYRILQSDLRKLTNDYSLKIVFNAKIIDEKYCVFGIEQTINNKVFHRLIVYDLEVQYPIRIIDFDANAFDYDRGKFIFSNKLGCLATLSLDQVPVLDDKELTDDYSVNYLNNTLLITSQESKNADITVLDITGSNIFTRKDISVNKGINSLNLNNELPCGIYFCFIQTTETTITRKFMVIK